MFCSVGEAASKASELGFPREKRPTNTRDAAQQSGDRAWPPSPGLGQVIFPTSSSPAAQLRSSSSAANKLHFLVNGAQTSHSDIFTFLPRTGTRARGGSSTRPGFIKPGKAMAINTDKADIPAEQWELPVPG